MKKTMTLALFGILGAGLLGTTVLQARSAAPRVAAVPWASAATEPARGRRVAAEGRVVTYPGA